MTTQRTPRKRSSTSFNLGGEQAEADPLLQDTFYASSDYKTIASRTDPRCFVIARTGGGKTALLQRLEEEHPERVIRITPEDLSLPYITDLSVIRYLDSLDVHLDLLFIALWKHVLLVELIRHRYKVDSPQAKQNFLTNLRERIQRNPAKQAALQYLDEFGSKFWEEADQRVREITRKFEDRIHAEAGGSVALPGLGATSAKLGTDRLESVESRVEQAERFQRVVNDTQLARLNQMLNVLNEDILNEAQHFTYVVIDDLDRDWVDDRLANDLIRCLFRTVLDLERVANLKVIVALRTNIFNQLHFGERTGGQEEKFRSLALHMNWGKNDLVQMLDDRVKVGAANAGVNFDSTRALLPVKNKTRGDPIDYVLSRTLMRPRDAIAFVNEAIRVSRGGSRITWQDIHAAERPYSNKRLLALRDEWKPTYYDIHMVFQKFRRTDVPLDRTEFVNRIDDAIMLLADRKFGGVRWLTELTEPLWSSGGSDEWSDIYQPFVNFLYRIGFIGCSLSAGGRFVYFYNDPDFAERSSTLESVVSFTVHPAFHAALDVREVVDR